MPHLRLDDQEFELSVGELRIGTDADAGVRLDAGAETGTLAIITVDVRGTAAVRRTAAQAAVSVNGVALGPEPTPLLHGDRIEVAGRQLRFSDDRKAGSTVLVRAFGAPAATAEPGMPAMGGAGASGGRLVSLVDGREYAVPPGGVRIGRDAACDIVVPGSDVSRQHAELSLGSRGYVLRDLSANGVFVNAQRTGDAQVLRRGDVIRIGAEEFRFYAEPQREAASEAAAQAASSAADVVQRLAPAAVGGAPAAASRVAPPTAAGAESSVPRRPASPRPAAVRRRAASRKAAESRRASVLVWIAAALVLGATLFYVIQDRS